MRTQFTLRQTLGAIALVSIPAFASAQLPITIQHARPLDQRGVNQFEPPKEDTVTFKGATLSFGGAFRQDFQGLGHSNTAAARMVSGINQNQLITVGHGFNNAVANGYLNAQLVKGVRVAMTSYLWARHHNEAWIKDGFILIDDSPINNPLLNGVMSHLTLKVGHFEI